MDITLTKQTSDLVLRAQGLVVKDQETLTRATEILAAGKGMVRLIKDFFSPLKQKAHASWKELCDTETAELARITPTLTFIERQIVNYRVEQDRIRREAEEKARRQEMERRRLEQEALRAAEAKAARAEAEQKRIDAEAAARALATKNRELAAKIERERQERQAALAAQAKADQDAILDKAAAAELEMGPAIAVPEKATTSGQALCHNWKFRVVDINQVPREYLVINEAYTGKMVRASEGKLQIPGIEIYDEPYMRSTGK